MFNNIFIKIILLFALIANTIQTSTLEAKYISCTECDN